MIIKDIADNDLYTFTVMYFYMQKFPRAIGEYTFIDRNRTCYTQEFLERLTNEIKAMADLRLDPTVKEYMKETMYFLPPFFFDFIDGYRFNPNEVTLYLDEDNHLNVKICGPLYRIVMWEVPLLAMISELSYVCDGVIPDMYYVIEKAKLKGKAIADSGIKVSDFGTRRRFSFEVQDTVLKELLEAAPANITGTSNVYLACRYGIKPIGTMSHQLISLVASVYGPQEANYFAMKMWQEVYDGALGVFLTDTYTSDVFFQNFGTKFAKLFDGLRHDSGDPFEYVDKVINKYKSLSIDPMSKAITFSNGLDIDTAIKINEYCKGLIKPQFGIGTFLTNDVFDISENKVKPKNIVIKLTKAAVTESRKMNECIKLSDDAGKFCGDEVTALIYKTLLNI